MKRGGPGARVLAALAALLIVSPLLVAAMPAGVAVSFQEMEESLTCQCGCGLTVHSCNHLQCPSALPLRQEIRAQMDEGKDKEAILAYFSNKYGEKILSAPTTSGFNLLAWITPFLVLGIAAALVGLVIVRWSGRVRPQPPIAPLPDQRRAPTPYDKILERELKDFDR